jgi:hypothetical protein
MTQRGWPFIGSEAVANGVVRKHELRSGFRAVFPDVYAPVDVRPTLGDRAAAAWLWSRRQGVLAGLTAAAVHGARWVDETAPIELIWPNARRPPGVRTFDMRLLPGETGQCGAMRVTTPARTAFDLGRRQPLAEAIARLDALGNATRVTAGDVLAIARCHRGVRGLRQLEVALDATDPGAASPKETWLRLLVTNAGYPRPQTQIKVLSPDGRRHYYLDMGWPSLMLAIEYDGEHHRLDPVQFAYDIRRTEDLQELGWNRLRVVKANRTADVLDRLRHAWESTLPTDRDIA